MFSFQDKEPRVHSLWADHVKQDTIKSRVEQLAELGKVPSGGVTRLVYSDVEREAANLVSTWMHESGLAVRQDSVGNLFGRWPDQSGPAVWTGSHLDSVPNGGSFDGVAGVVAGLTAVESLKATGAIPQHPIDVCVFVGEEGSRFPGLLGSRAVAMGLSDRDLIVEDEDGIKLAEAMRSCGLDPTAAATARAEVGEILAFLELHVEQGPVLDGMSLPVGVVTHVAGPVVLEASLSGNADHAGTTPMNARCDSLAAAAEIILAVEERASAAGSTAVATVGSISVSPGAVNVIPGKTSFTIDIRDTTLEGRDRLEEEIKTALASIARRRKSLSASQELLRAEPIGLSEELIAVLEEAVREENLKLRRLPSGAGHDAMIIASVAPAAMLFVRSAGGRSHSPEERTDFQDLMRGTRVLARSLGRLAKAD